MKKSSPTALRRLNRIYEEVDILAGEASSLTLRQGGLNVADRAKATKVTESLAALIESAANLNDTETV